MTPATLEDLAQVYGVSRERIRQIEARAFERCDEGGARHRSERQPAARPRGLTDGRAAAARLLLEARAAPAAYKLLSPT